MQDLFYAGTFEKQKRRETTDQSIKKMSPEKIKEMEKKANMDNF